MMCLRGVREQLHKYYLYELCSSNSSKHLTETDVHLHKQFIGYRAKRLVDMYDRTKSQCVSSLATVLQSLQFPQVSILFVSSGSSSVNAISTP
jgi:hypothetical protein